MVLAHTLDGHGPERVLMLHDWLGDSSTYDAAVPYFDPAALALARVDLPGYGRSRAHAFRVNDSGGVDPGALDAEVLAVAEHLGWPRFHLVTHSMSTVIAQRLARSSPARLASVTLVTPVTPGTRLPDPVVDFLRGVGRDPGRRREALAAQSGGRLSPRWLDWKLERWADRSDPAAVVAYVDLFARPELATTRADVQVSALAITGAHESVFVQRRNGSVPTEDTPPAPAPTPNPPPA